jgi:uncharacterized protein YecE (DUF72 family)
VKRLPPDAQLDLFAEMAEPAPTDDPALRALAARLPAHVRFGTSSWTFPGWQGLVYARRYPSRAAFLHESLAEYARHPLFRTVGIDRSFYAPLSADELRAYAAQLPPDFRAVSKVFSEITTHTFPNHPSLGARAGQPNPYFLDVPLFTERVAAPYAEAFAVHAGPFVIEIPPAPGAITAEALAARLDVFFDHAPRAFRYAVELRDRALFTPRYLEVLRAHGVAHVLSQWSRMPTFGEQHATPGVLTADFCVARLLLPKNTRYAQLKEAFDPFDAIVAPQPALRTDVCRLVAQTGEPPRETYVLVNNKAEGSAPLTIRAIAEELTSAADAGWLFD